MKYAPVLIPTLDRIDHLKRCIESLKRCTDAGFTDIFIGLDFPLSEKCGGGYNAIVDYFNSGDFSEFKSLNVIKREKNYGYWNNINALKSYVMEKYDTFITMQDDIEVSPNFLVYMNILLSEFENDNTVIAVSGYSYPVAWSVSDRATYIKQNFVAAEWGIGFWRDKYLEIEKKLADDYLYKNFSKAYKEKKFNQMIDACVIDYVDSSISLYSKESLLRKVCDVSLRIYLSVADKYVLMPVLSKTRNHGFDGSGIFCQPIKESSKNKEIYADCMDYDNQKIDLSDYFYAVPDRKNDLNINREKLNFFDRRDKKKMISIHKKIQKYVFWGPGIYRYSLLFKAYYKAVIRKLQFSNRAKI